MSTTTLAPDRVALTRVELVALTIFTSMSVGFATLTVPSEGRSVMTGFGAGALSGALAVLALRSLPIRWVSRTIVMVGALMLARFGQLSGPESVFAAPGVVGWAAATAMVFVLAARAEHRANRHTGLGRAGTSMTALARDAIAVAAILAGITLALGPAAAARFDQGPGEGDAPDFDDFQKSSPLAASSQLDMTTRPRLSERMVLTVEADAASFWRAQTFDQWNGQRWRRSDNRRTNVGDDGRIDTRPSDLGAKGPQTIEQTFRLVAPYGVVLPAAPSPVRIDAKARIRQGPDGALEPEAPFGSGATYSVTSRQATVTERELRSTDDAEIPDDIIEAYTTAPATKRVSEMAAEVTAGSENNYERVRRLIDWLGNRVTYSLDAPLSPKDSDVVDDFLFESREGWCEQIASSLVVMLRRSGVPARIATGFVPGQRNSITKRFEVRESDAHAWAEVWFPRLGWVPFDPTANVPLSGDAGESSETDDLAGNLGLVLLAIGVAVVVAEPLVRVLRRRRGGTDRARRRRRSNGWEATMELRLDKVGRKVAQARRVDQTASDYGVELSSTWHDPRLVRVGAIIDRSLYAPDDPPPEDRHFVEQTLTELEKAPPAT